MSPDVHVNKIKMVPITNLNFKKKNVPGFTSDRY